VKNYVSVNELVIIFFREIFTDQRKPLNCIHYTSGGQRFSKNKRRSRLRFLLIKSAALALPLVILVSSAACAAALKKTAALILPLILPLILEYFGKRQKHSMKTIVQSDSVELACHK